MSFFFKVARINDPAQIADGVITTPKLADGAVTSAKIADGTIATVDLSEDMLAFILITGGAQP